jgi:mRNA interferase HigB
VNVISRRTIVDASKRHPVCASWLHRWWRVAKAAEWTCLDDVREVFPSVDQVGQRLVFDATAGRRLIVGVSYASDPIQGKGGGKGALFVKVLLTHAEYDRNKWKD